MRVGLFFNHELDSSARVAGKISGASYGELDVEFVPGDAGADHGSLDLAVSIGGDGTFLLTSKTIMGHGIPLYGINTGRLGFLALGEAPSAVDDMRRILSGEYALQSRVPLLCEIRREGRAIEAVRAMNEIMIVKNFVSRPIALSAYVGDERLYGFLADGIIVSTPTGSTAYALSAGGPVVHPRVKCVVVIPVCPHSLSSRPIAIPDGETITVMIESSPYGAILSADGQNNADLVSGDEAVIRSDDENTIEIITLDGVSYLDALRDKMNW
jgi:NAD+ kinase